MAWAAAPPAAAPSADSSEEQDTWLWSKDGRRLVDSQRRPVELKNNPEAKDVSLQQVVAFVKANQVNTHAYETGKFMCTEFALGLHDAAEAAGIRCGLVGIRFQQGQGHALNIFKTTDKGLVYVDCTGSPSPDSDRALFDTIAYVQIGRPYGRLPLEIGAFDPNHYERYPYVMGLWAKSMAEQRQLQVELAKLQGQREQFKKGIAQFQRVDEAYPGSPEAVARYDALAKQEAALEKKRVEINTRYEKMVAQFKRLNVRYDMNPSPVRSVDIWW
jgi:hypothetical protein